MRVESRPASRAVFRSGGTCPVLWGPGATRRNLVRVGDLETAEPVEDVQDAEAVERTVQRDEAHVLAVALGTTVTPTQLGHLGNRLQTKSVRTGGELEHIVHLLSGWSSRGRLLNAPAAGVLVGRAISNPGDSPRMWRPPDTSAGEPDDLSDRDLGHPLRRTARRAPQLHLCPAAPGPGPRTLLRESEYP